MVYEATAHLRVLRAGGAFTNVGQPRGRGTGEQARNTTRARHPLNPSHTKHTQTNLYGRPKGRKRDTRCARRGRRLGGVHLIGSGEPNEAAYPFLPSPPGRSSGGGSGGGRRADNGGRASQALRIAPVDSETSYRPRVLSEGRKRRPLSRRGALASLAALWEGSLRACRRAGGVGRAQAGSPRPDRQRSRRDSNPRPPG